MIYINQLSPKKYGVKRNQEFFRGMFNGEFKEVNKWFDKLSCVYVNRRLDPDMNFETYIGIINKQSMIRLQLASPDPNKIVYAIISKYKLIESVFFLNCPYTDENFELVSGLYRESFGIKLEDEPVLEGLVEYYTRRVNNYKM